MNSSRAARGVLAASAAAFALAVVTLSRTPGPRAWALHLPGFLSDPARSLVLALLLGGAALLAFDFLRGDAKDTSRPRGAKVRGAKQAARAGTRLPPWTGWLLLLPWAWLLWKLETRTRFLGDGTVWLQGIQAGNSPPFSEPLAAAAWAAYGRLLHALGLPVDAVTAGLLPILCGLIAAALFWGIASEVTSGSGSRVIAFAVLATLGTAQLYFGYIESYPVVSVVMLLYLWLGLRRLRGADHAIASALALAVAIASHLSCLFLLPSFLYVALREKRPWLVRAALALAPVAGAALLLVLLGYPPARWVGAFGIAARAIEPGHAATALSRPYGALSLDHAWDVLNAILLVLPVPAMLLLAAIAGRGDRGQNERPLGDPAAMFLAIAAGAGLLLAASLVLPVAPAQDWDLTSILLLPLAVLGVRLGFSIPKAPIRGARGVGLVLLGAGALLSFVLVNADEESGLRRYETIVGPGAKITPYAKAYGNELLATYDASRGDFARAAVHAQRALDAEPTNPRYWVKKGAALYELGRYDEAISALEEAIRRGPRDDAYYNLGNCLAKKRRYPEAVVNFREALKRSEARPDYFNNLAVALFYSGEKDSARVYWTEVVRRWPWYTLSQRSLQQHFGGADSARATSTPG